MKAFPSPQRRNCIPNQMLFHNPCHAYRPSKLLCSLAKAKKLYSFISVEGSGPEGSIYSACESCKRHEGPSKSCCKSGLAVEVPAAVPPCKDTWSQKTQHILFLVRSEQNQIIQNIWRKMGREGGQKTAYVSNSLC